MIIRMARWNDNNYQPQASLPLTFFFMEAEFTSDCNSEVPPYRSYPHKPSFMHFNQ